MTTRRRKSETPIPVAKNVVQLLKEEELLRLPLGEIIVPEWHPRKYIDPDRQAGLVARARENGVVEPFVLRQGNELILDKRKYLAAVTAGCVEAPVIILNLTDEQALAMALTSDMHQDALHPFEQTEAILELVTLRLGVGVQELLSTLHRLKNDVRNNVVPNNEEAHFVEQAFADLGITPLSFLQHRVPLLRLADPLKSAMRAGNLNYTKALAISRVSDEELRAKILQQSIDEQLTLTQIKSLLPENQAATPTFRKRLNTLVTRLKKAGIFKDPKKMRKVETYLGKIEQIIALEEAASTPEENE